MFIRKVISFGNAWAMLEKRIVLISDIKGFVESISVEKMRSAKDKFNSEKHNEINTSKIYSCWEGIVEESGWIISRKYLSDNSENIKYCSFLGHCSGDVSIGYLHNREIVNRWLFSSTPIAYKNSIINIPVGVMMTSSDQSYLLCGKNGRMESTNFERTVDELTALSPLSQSHPFVLLGISFEDGDLEVIEIESELGIAEKQVVINRSIEFPPEYHSAGLGILSYFGTVLREKYPDQEAKVKIEQDGQIVRMIIETKDGNKEIIEKALQEYELVITGAALPETLYDDALKVLELKTELRVAHTRIEGQRDLLIHKGQELSDLKSLFSDSLSKGNGQLQTITVSPVINVITSQKNNTVINNDILDVADEIRSLVTKSGDDAGTELKLLDLNGSVENIGAAASPEEVKSSIGFTKLKMFIEEATKTGSDVNKFFEGISDGVDKLKCLGSKYNSIAEWCGAPQIPNIFVK
jgi:hypothetical protein